MATPVTLKKAEEAKKKAQEKREQKSQGSLASSYLKKYNTYRTPKNIDFTADLASGRQYTSFEKNGNDSRKFYNYNNNNGYRPKRNNNFGKRVPPPVQEVVEVPLGMGTDDYIIDSKNIVCFSGKEHFLSNLSPSLLLIDGHEYKSVEHYYQACKLYSLAGSEYALEVRDVEEPVQVKVKAKRILSSLKIPMTKIDEWKATQGFIMLYNAMVHKFVQNLELRKMLADTDDAILVQAYDRDSFYACGLNKEGVEKWAIENEGKVVKIPSELNFENVKYIPLIGIGKNIVGAMCMKIRKIVVELEHDKKEVNIDPFLSSMMSTIKIDDDKELIAVSAEN